MDGEFHWGFEIRERRELGPGGGLDEPQEAFPAAAVDPVDVKAVVPAVIELMRVRQQTGRLISGRGHLAQGAGHFPQAQGTGFQMAPLAVQPREWTAKGGDRDVHHPAIRRNIVYDGKDLIQTRFNRAMGVQVAVRANQQAAIDHGEQGVAISRQTACPERFGRGSRDPLEDIPSGGDQAGLFRPSRLAISGWR